MRASSSAALLPVSEQQPPARTAAPRGRAIAVTVGSLAAVVVLVGVSVYKAANNNRSIGPGQQVVGASPKRLVTQAEANKKATDVAPGTVVAGADRFVWFGIGDWGRCGSPTTNPATRAARCNSQLSLVPSMEAFAAALAPTFIMSVGDQFYDGESPCLL